MNETRLKELFQRDEKLKEARFCDESTLRQRTLILAIRSKAVHRLQMQSCFGNATLTSSEKILHEA